MAGKVRTVAWQLEEVVEELPLFILKLDWFSKLLDEHLDFGTFKFCFVVAATFVVRTQFEP